MALNPVLERHCLSALPVPPPRICAALLLACSLAAVPGAAQASEVDENTKVPPPEFRYFACDQQYGRDKDVIEATREGLDELVCEAHLWVDGLFGGQANIYAARRSGGELSVTTDFSEREGWATRLRLRVRFTLPALKNRLSAFVGREPNNDFVSGRADSLALREQFPALEDEDQWLAGLGYEIPAGYRLRSSFRIGARRLSNPEVFVRNRFYWNALASRSHIFNLRLIPFWTNKDEFGVTAGLDYAVALSNLTLLRWDLVGTTSASTEEVSWRAATVLYRSLRPETGLALELYANGDTGETEPLREYGTRGLLRFPLSAKRLYVLLSAGPTWYQPGDASRPRRHYFVSRLTVNLPFGL